MPSAASKLVFRRMRHTGIATAVAFATLACAHARSALAVARPAHCVIRLDLSAIITTAIAEYIEDGVHVAEARGCAALVVIDTPGGELDATRRIVRSFLGARTPVIAYVSPSGARAGSAGMLVTIAAHVAAMAPGTEIGASHPVTGLGQDPEKVGEHMGQKVENDAAAFARAIAQQRGRNVRWAEDAVRKSVSSTAREALAGGVIDRLADSEAGLLAAIDGTVVTTRAGPTVLSTADATVTDHHMTVSQRLRSALGNPGLVYVLFLVGVVGLFIELTTPGVIVPGVLGVVALLMAGVGMNVLPVNVSAVLFMLLGGGLVIAEVFTATYGLLAIIGAVVLGFGAMFLVDRDAENLFADTSVGVSWTLVVPSLIAIAAGAIALAWRARNVRRRAAVTGAEAMLGRLARVVVEIGDREPGQVEIDGERWRAVADAPLSAGDDVRIDALHGVTVHVTRVTATGGMP